MNDESVDDYNKQRDIAKYKLFTDVKERIETSFQTTLNIIVCGPGKPIDHNPSHPFFLREAIKNELINTHKDNVFYIEELLKETEWIKMIKELENQIGRKASLSDIEINIMKSQTLDKDIHLAEGLGSILELRDFENHPDICRKMKIFTHRRHAESVSYASDLMMRLQSKGVSVYWYENEEDLKKKVIDSLKHNRFIKKTYQDTVR